MRSRGGVIAVGLALAVAACGSPGPVTVDGVTILRHKILGASPAALFSGTLHFRDGCVWGDAEPSGEAQVMVWPRSSHLERRDGRLVLVVDDVVLEDGDSFSIGGGQEPIELIRELAGPIPDECLADLYWLGNDINPASGEAS
jgi:hypothetical protein